MTRDYEALRSRAVEDERRSRVAAKAAAAAAARQAKQERSDIELSTDRLLALLRPYERALFDDGLRLEIVESKASSASGLPAHNTMYLLYHSRVWSENRWAYVSCGIVNIEVTSVPPVYRVSRANISTNDATEVVAHMLQEAARAVPFAKEARKEIGWFDWYFGKDYQGRRYSGPLLCGFVTRR